MSIFSKIKTGIRMTGQYYADELRSIFKDSGAVLILFGALVIYSLIYSVAYKNEVIKNIEIAVVDFDNTLSSRKLIQIVNGTEQININQYAGNIDEAKNLFFAGKTKGILAIPAGFEKKILSGQQADVAIYADGSYFLIYRQTISGAVKAVGTFSAGVEIKKRMLGGEGYEQAFRSRDPLSADLHFWFNASSGYGTFVMPGLIIIIIQQTLLIALGMLGGTQKEKGRPSFIVPQALTRGGVYPILFGKTFAYLTIYALTSIITMVWFHDWFSFPSRAGFFQVTALFIPFLLSVIFLGITLSVLFKQRESSLMFLVFLSPIVVFLSGISWPAQAIPPLLNKLAMLFPSTLAIPAYLRLRIMGVDFQAVKHEYLLLVLQTCIYFATASAALFISAWNNKKRERKALKETGQSQ